MQTVKRYCAVLCAFLLIFAANASFYAASNVYSYCKNDDRKIALTFDDGPHPKYTAEILEILDRYDIRATFFLIGSCAKEYPDLVRQEVEKGHEIGNHTYSHLKLYHATQSALKEELSKTDTLLTQLTQKNIRLFRPPEGYCSKSITALSEDFGYQVILWNIDTRDWAHTPLDTIVTNVKKNVKSGDILLFHDYIAKDSPTPAALEILIPYLLSEGYRFVTVSELISCEV